MSSGPIYPHPVDFKQALQSRVLKSILPTGLDSAMLKTLPRAVRERAMFSATVQNVHFLEQAAAAVQRILAGETNKGTERTLLRELADGLGLDQIAKDPRLNLILDTQIKMADGYGNWIEGQHPSVLDMWPCQELYRAEERKEPRDWPARWADAGGEFFKGESDYPEGRMIALKNDAIWEDISEFGLPYAPFDYNSGMDVRDVDHDEAVELGIIDDDYLPTPETQGFNKGLQASLGPVDKLGLSFQIGQVLGDLGSLSPSGLLKFIGG